MHAKTAPDSTSFENDTYSISIGVFRSFITRFGCDEKVSLILFYLSGKSNTFSKNYRSGVQSGGNRAIAPRNFQKHFENANNLLSC